MSNYSRFYALLNRLPVHDEEMKERLGIDTTDWTRINAFCRDVRIAGKEFGALGPEELDALTMKLRAIERHGGLKALPKQPKPACRIGTDELQHKELQQR